MNEPPETSENTWTGATSRDWTDGSNWSTGAMPDGGTSAAVEGPSPRPPVLGETSQATGATKALVVDGTLDAGGSLTLQNNSALTVESMTVGIGEATVSGGSRLTTLATGGLFVDGGAGVSGQLTVTGAGSTVVVEARTLEACVVGRKGAGILTVSDAASVHVAWDLLVGQNLGQGKAFVLDRGRLTVGRYIYVGLAGPDTGNDPDMLGDIVVATGGHVTAGERLVIGEDAPASLSISNATVTAPIVKVGDQATCTLQVLAGGVLETRALAQGYDKSQVNFDGGTIRATGDSGNGLELISSVSGAVTIGPSGLTIDDGGHVAAVVAVLGGPGGMTKVGSGTLALRADNTYLAGTRVDDGILRIENSVTGDVLVSTGAAVVFDHGREYPFGGAISGGGRVEQNGLDLYFLRDHTYTGGTTISSGRLLLGKNTTEGSIVGDVTVAAGSGLVFWRSDTYVFAGRVSGDGAVRKDGAGVTVLTGVCTHTGGTGVMQGTLQLGDGGVAGHLAGNVEVSGANEWLPAATFAFRKSDTCTFDGIISGGGGVTQAGSGTVILTAANTYSGPTIVEAGTLQVAGSIASAVTVRDGGTLCGSGTIGGQVTSSGVVSPGANGTGTLTIDGAFTSDGGTLAIAASLGGDDSPHTLLRIAGDAVMGSGPTSVTIGDAGGTGAATVGDGIKIVEVGGASPAGLFVLASPVVVGPHRYELVQGSVSNPDDGDWYLRAAGVGA